MNWQALLIASLGILLPTALVQMYPMWQQRFFFTVRVPEGFRETGPGRAILRTFRLAIWVTALGCVLAMCAGTWLMLPAPLVNSLAMIGLLQWARVKTLPYAAPAAGTVRRAALIADADEPWWIWVAPALGLAVMGTAAAYVTLHWDALPERLPIHWGLDGQPNRWVHKTVMGVYGSLFIGLAVQAQMVCLLYGLNQASAAESLRRRLNKNLLAAIGLALSVVFAVTMLTPLRGSSAGLPGPAWIWMALPVLFLAPTVAMAIRLQRSEAEEVEPTRDENWWLGVFYADSSDSRMMVPNRMGAGYSPNLGHPVMRILTPLLVLVVLGTVLAVATLT